MFFETSAKLKLTEGYQFALRESFRTFYSVPVRTPDFDLKTAIPDSVLTYE